MRSASTVLLRTQSDARLVALAGAGHDRAFEAIVERYRRPLLRACRRILPEARAEDALQLALVAAWTGLRRGDDVRELRSWLYRIVRNTALNQLRAAGSDLDELVDTLAAAEGPAEAVERRALVHRTLAAIAALPDRQRDALLRTAIAGQGQEDVARDLGLSSTAVRQLVHRARVSVRTAATALVPWPLAAWLAAAGARGEPRIAELVATAGAAGGSAWAAKAGAVAVIAGSAVTAPTVVDHPDEREGPPPEAREPAEAPAAEAADEAPPHAAAGQPTREGRAERDDEDPARERVAAADGTTRAGDERGDAESQMVERRPDAGQRGGGEDPPAAAPTPSPAGTPAAPQPVAVTAPEPAAVDVPAEGAEDPVTEVPGEGETTAEGPPEDGEPEEPAGGGEAETGAGEDVPVPSDP